MIPTIRWRTTSRIRSEVLVGVALSVVASACGGGGTTDPGGGNNPPGGTTPTTVTLTITSRSLDAGYAAGPIFTYVGDVTETRARMPQLMNENGATVRPAGETSKTTTLTVPRGKFVTLFATELGRAGFNARPVGTQLSKIVPASATEFSGWTGATLGRPEAGVATIKMDADATVTAEYRKMEGMTYAFLGCQDVNINAAGPGYLGFGTLDPNVITPTGNNPGNSPVDYEFTYAYGKQGTLFTFKALKYEVRAAVSETGFMNWSGAGSSCGTSLTCNVTIPAFGASTAVVRSNNSYLSNGTTTACGGCNPALGCALTMRP
ncbi:MAG: hypothetical protein H7Z40_09535 [Phycisphaerae bacterium]|nr:hypothetical protein [Gemmatimonadaceae bacterium]